MNLMDIMWPLVLLVVVVRDGLIQWQQGKTLGSIANLLAPPPPPVRSVVTGPAAPPIPSTPLPAPPVAPRQSVEAAAPVRVPPRPVPATPSPVPPAAPSPFASAPPWFQLGLKDIGIHEGPDNTGPAIAAFITQAHAGAQHDPWCAIWTNAKLESSGTPGSRSASSQSFRTHPSFVALAGPALGAIVVFWRGSTSSGLGHVGFYYGENANKIWVLGGNEDDMVQIEAIPKSSPSFGLVGYFWPKSVALPTIGAIILPTTTPTSIQKTPAGVIAAAPATAQPGKYTDIVATMFGSAAVDASANMSAYGGPIHDDQPGVALPFHFKGVRRRVRVTGKQSGLSIDCDIVDVGPWNTNDPYWTTNTRPQSETGTDMTGRHTNKAGIDLTLAAAQAIQINGKGLVDWEFIDQAPTSTSGDPKVV